MKSPSPAVIAIFWAVLIVVGLSTIGSIWPGLVNYKSNPGAYLRWWELAAIVAVFYLYACSGIPQQYPRHQLWREFWGIDMELDFEWLMLVIVVLVSLVVGFWFGII